MYEEKRKHMKKETKLFVCEGSPFKLRWKMKITGDTLSKGG